MAEPPVQPEADSDDGRMMAAGVIGGAAAAVVVTWWMSRSRRRRRAIRRVHYLRGRLRGWRYRLLGGHPVTIVSDSVLTDRVRSELGKTTRQLDVPRVHVAVSHGVVLLHGQVGSDADADTIEVAAQRVEGVDGVLSYLHVGLAPGQTRPSEGALVHGASPGLRRLLAAARSAGIAEPAAEPAVRAVLATFLERLPAGTQAHLMAHLPRDVQLLATSPRRHGAQTWWRRFDDFIDAVIAADRMDRAQATEAVSAVLAALRELVPEEAAHVAAVLPHELRPLWELAPAGR